MKELIKTLVLSALIAATLILTVLNWLYDPVLLESPAFSWARGLAGFLGLAEERPPGEEFRDSVRHAAVLPLKVCVTKAGVRLGAMYDDVAVAAMYEQVSVFLGEALSASVSSEAVSQEEWEEMLMGDNIYFEYQTPLELGLLAAWLKAETMLDGSSASIALSFGEGTAELFYQDGSRFYRAGGLPASPMPEIKNSAQEFVPCFFLFERVQSAASEQSGVLLPEILSLPTLAAAPPDEPQAEAGPFLQKLAISPGTNSKYTLQGEDVYVDNFRTCRISSDGIIYRNPSPVPDERLAIIDDSPAGQVETARVLAETLDVFLGDAEFVLSEVSRTSQSSVFLFAPRSGGVPVVSGAYVRIEIENGVITAVTAFLRRYEKTSASWHVLPAAQALTLLKTENAVPELIYFDDASLDEAILQASWYVNGG